MSSTIFVGWIGFNTRVRSCSRSFALSMMMTTARPSRPPVSRFSQKADELDIEAVERLRADKMSAYSYGSADSGKACGCSAYQKRTPIECGKPSMVTRSCSPCHKPPWISLTTLRPSKNDRLVERHRPAPGVPHRTGAIPAPGRRSPSRHLPLRVSTQANFSGETVLSECGSLRTN
jgi:hypothetical protein